MKKLDEYAQAAAMSKLTADLGKAFLPLQVFLRANIGKYASPDGQSLAFGRAVKDFMETPEGLATIHGVVSTAYLLVATNFGYSTTT